MQSKNRRRESPWYLSYFGVHSNFGERGGHSTPGASSYGAVEPGHGRRYTLNTEGPDRPVAVYCLSVHVFPSLRPVFSQMSICMFSDFSRTTAVNARHLISLTKLETLILHGFKDSWGWIRGLLNTPRILEIRGELQRHIHYYTLSISARHGQS